MKKLKIAIVLLLGVMLVSGLACCGDGGGLPTPTPTLTPTPTPTPRPENEPPSAYIDSISPSPATVDEAVTLNGHGTDTDGSVIAYNWASKTDGEIGTTASLTTSALSIGTHIILFRVQDNDGVWSDEVNVQLTIEAGIEEEVGMEGAIDVVVEDILPTIPEIMAGGPYWCLKLDDVLPEGTVIEEDSGHTLRITLQEDMYFFYLDLAPDAMYSHPVKYILVDNEGNHDVYDAEWWPLINNVVPEALMNTIPDEADVIDANVELTQPTGTPMSFAIAPIQIKRPDGFIVVNGYDSDRPGFYDAYNTASQIWRFFDAHKSEYSQVLWLDPPSLQSLFSAIDDMADEGLSPITIYIISPANPDSVVVVGQHIYANQFRFKMAEHPHTTFNFILQSPYSGSFIDDLSTLDNVCVVATSASEDERSYWDVDYDFWGCLFAGIEGECVDANPSDYGSEWTSSLLKAMREIVGDSDNMDLLRDMAGYYGVPETCMLICLARWGALGLLPEFGLDVNYDFSNFLGMTHPSGYCSYEAIY